MQALHRNSSVRALTALALLLALVAALTLALAACGAMRNDDDDDDDADDDSGDDDDYDPDDTTIYDLQQGRVPEDTLVTCKGVIVTSPLADDQPAIFVQEPEGGEYSGIYVYLYDEVVAELDVIPGDVVDVTGVYQEYYGLSELTVQAPADLVISGGDQNVQPAVVEPADVATNGAQAEAYEGVLIKVEDVSVTNPDLGYGMFEVDGGLAVDDFFFPEGEDPQVGQGEHFDAIIGPLYYSFETFMITPRSDDDLVGGAGDDDDDDTTIYDIQQGDVPEESEVSLASVIASSPLTSGGQGFFVQEPAGGQWSGIYVFVQNPGGKALAIEPGDEVSLSGQYVEHFGLSEIVVAKGSDVTVTGSVAAPQPAVVDPADVGTGGSLAEAYEGVLIRVEDVTVTDADLGNGEWEVDDVLILDNIFFNATHPLGATYESITGCHYYSFDDFKLEPRSAADLVLQ